MTFMTNDQSLSIPVIMGQTGERTVITFNPHELLVNDAGFVVMISMRYNDGDVGNFLIQEKRTTEQHRILDFFRDYLAPLGLHIASGRIQAKYPEQANIKLVSHLVEKFGPTAVNPIVDALGRYLTPPDWGYYEITSGEFIFDHAIRLQLS